MNHDFGPDERVELGLVTRMLFIQRTCKLCNYQVTISCDKNGEPDHRYPLTFHRSGIEIHEAPECWGGKNPE